MSGEKKIKKKGRVMWGFIYTFAFILAFGGSVLFKMNYHPFGKEFSVDWNDSVGTVHTDISYGSGEANKFDLYVPADDSRSSYGLIVYLHPGGFTSGDKSGDAEILTWLCSKGYVTAGINYTLFSEKNPDANVYTQSVEIKESMEYVVAEAEKLGYPIGEMAIGGGSAGHALAMIYAYRDAEESPVPVKMTFGAVGPSCFYVEDWINMGADPNKPVSFDPNGDYQGVADLFSAMSGNKITNDMFKTGEYIELVKNISAEMWIDENSVPTVVAYGSWDKVQAFGASLKLRQTLENNGIDYQYFEMKHSGHGLQNDNKMYGEYMRKIVEYLDTYMPVK
ncbi:alpha/beta hydrolase [Hominifimenecus sp. rT4P-3]|uniref:alpha/beta hydrolase n=1 Tax=Hominifimenecus sp. rT4P-3 TaxID=3242979 RepID=UPI003DA3443D